MDEFDRPAAGHEPARGARDQTSRGGPLISNDADFVNREDVAAEFAARSQGRLRYGPGWMGQRKKTWLARTGDEWVADYSVLRQIIELCARHARQHPDDARRIASYRFARSVEVMCRKLMAAPPVPRKIKEPLRVIDFGGALPVYVAEISAHGPRTVRFKCPYCRSWHVHGWPRGDGNRLHRGAHCHSREGREAHGVSGYVLIIKGGRS